MQEHTSDKKLYSPRAASQELGGISIWYLRKAIARGFVRATRLGSRVFISSAECARIQREGLPSLTRPVK